MEIDMYFPDLSVYNYHVWSPLKSVRCVGWLDAEHPYTTGDPPSWFNERLETIFLHRTQAFDAHVNVMRGIHLCNLCRSEFALFSEGKRHPLGMAEIWLPDGPRWLAAPSLVLHYVKAHGYMPPLPFIEAVQTISTDDEFLAQHVYDRLLQESHKNVEDLC